MKTPPKHKPDEVTKRLFRQLFEAQHRLERYTDDSNYQAQMIIAIIDYLLERMLKESDE